MTLKRVLLILFAVVDWMIAAWTAVIALLAAKVPATHFHLHAASVCVTGRIANIERIQNPPDYHQSRGFILLCFVV